MDTSNVSGAHGARSTPHARSNFAARLTLIAMRIVNAGSIILLQGLAAPPNELASDCVMKPLHRENEKSRDDR